MPKHATAECFAESGSSPPAEVERAQADPASTPRRPSSARPRTKKATTTRLRHAAYLIENAIADLADVEDDLVSIAGSRALDAAAELREAAVAMLRAARTAR